MKKNRQLLAFYSFVLLCFALNGQPGKSKTDNSIFWEVSGNGLKQPSYLFGTLHLLTSSFVDSLPNTLAIVKNCKAVAGEIIMDSTVVAKLTDMTFMTDQTLDGILGKSVYKKTAEWLKELSGYDLSLFNKVNPMMLNLMLMTLVQQKYYPQPKAKGMDEYFQSLAKETNKKVIGLETAEDQIKSLFGQFTIKRQAEMLTEFVERKEECVKEIGAMFNAYRSQDISSLVGLLHKENSYTEAEKKALLDKRNDNWMKILPQLFSEQSTFVAVGALHLYGPTGLVELLRKNGYEVKSISIR